MSRTALEGPTLLAGLDTWRDLAVTYDNYGVTTWALLDESGPRRLGGAALPLFRPRASYDNWHLDPRGWVFAQDVGPLWVVDLRQPEAPIATAHTLDGLPLAAGAMAGGSDWLAVVGFQGGRATLTLLDTTDPADPQVLWTDPARWTQHGGPDAIAATADLLLVVSLDSQSSRGGWLAVLDPVTQGRPTVLSVTRLPDFGWYRLFSSGIVLSAHGDRALLGALDDHPLGRSFVIDLSDPSAPATYPLDPILGDALLEAAAWQGPTAIVAARITSGSKRVRTTISRIDLTDPESPGLVDELSSSEGSASSPDMVAALDRLVVSTASRAALEVYDPDDGYRKVASLRPLLNPQDLAVAGGLGVLAAGPAGVACLDLSTPEAPEVIGRAPLDGSALRVVLEGGLAYAAADDGGLQVVDVRRPDQPLVVGSAPTTTAALAVAAADGLAAVVVAGSDEHPPGLELLDVHDPTAPATVATLALEGRGPSLQRWDAGVRLAGGTAYVALNGELWIVDVTDPADPTLSASLVVGDSLSGATDVEVVDGYAYVTTSVGPPLVVDVHRTAAPVAVGRLDCQVGCEYVGRVRADGRRLALAGGSGIGVAAVDDLEDVSQAWHPTASAFFTGFGVIAGDNMYALEDPYLSVLTLTCPEQAARRAQSRVAP